MEGLDVSMMSETEDLVQIFMKLDHGVIPLGDGGSYLWTCNILVYHASWAGSRQLIWLKKTLWAVWCAAGALTPEG